MPEPFDPIVQLAIDLTAKRNAERKRADGYAGPDSPPGIVVPAIAPGRTGIGALTPVGRKEERMAKFITKEIEVEVRQFGTTYQVFSGQEGNVSRIEMSQTEFLRFLQPIDDDAYEMQALAAKEKHEVDVHVKPSGSFCE